MSERLWVLKDAKSILRRVLLRYLDVVSVEDREHLRRALECVARLRESEELTQQELRRNTDAL